MATEKDCSICLEYRGELGKAPLFSCENSKCDGKFHRSCLRQYLKTQRDKKTLGAVSTVICPILFCKTKIEIDLND